MGGHVWFRGDDEEPTDAERKSPLVKDPLERVRVLIVTSDPASRTGLRAALGLHEDVRVVAEAADAREAISEVRAKAPDVVVLDGVPAPGAVEAVRRVLAEVPGGKALVVGSSEDPSSVREAFGAGASGYVLEGAVETDIVAAVRAVAAGQGYVDPVLGARVIAGEERGREDASDDPLTSRQREVVRLLARGHTNQEIAERLVLSVRTVETHRAHVMQKLRISTRAELVRYAIDRGLLTD